MDKLVQHDIHYRSIWNYLNHSKWLTAYHYGHDRLHLPVQSVMSHELKGDKACLKLRGRSGVFPWYSDLSLGLGIKEILLKMVLKAYKHNKYHQFLHHARITRQRARTVYPSGNLSYFCFHSLAFCLVFCRSLFVHLSLFYFNHCMVCP